MFFILRDRWLQDFGEQLICQIELFAMVALRWQLGELLKGRRSIWWVHNEAARYCLIQGVSGSKSMQKLCRSFYDLEALHPTFSWVERVPSYSNPADAPSCLGNFTGPSSHSAVAHLRGYLRKGGISYQLKAYGQHGGYTPTYDGCPPCHVENE